MSNGLDNMLARSSIEYRINYLLNTIKAYLDRVEFPNNQLYHTLSVIRYNMEHIDKLDVQDANIYKYKALNYLENLNHSFIWRYGAI